jgi:hypothetical protein
MKTEQQAVEIGRGLRYIAQMHQSQEAKQQAGGHTPGLQTRYMEGVFTPLDSEEVQSACRKLWDELDARQSDLLEALRGLMVFIPEAERLAECTGSSTPPAQAAIDAALLAIAKAEGKL